MAHGVSTVLIVLIFGNIILDSFLLYSDSILSADNCTTTCASGHCIYDNWLCDNEADCHDGSDEMNCGNTTCTPGHVSCGKDNQCIPEMWMCDGVADCADEEDERNCAETKCVTDFQCKDKKRCISNRWRCDSETDCEDGSDEEDCDSQVCPGFKCHQGPCILDTWKCDGDRDCPDNSDELNCTTTDGGLTGHPISTCELDSFKCVNSGECIHKAWRCDGDPDCIDHSDENDESCTLYKCGPDQFACSDNKTCIPESLKCDSNIDCQDGSDEIECPIVRECSDDQFDCTGKGESCVDNSLLCNKFNDCDGGEDEDEKICNRPGCKDENVANCSHSCVDLHTHILCTCPRGMQLAKNNKTCEDVNECLVPATCSHICINKPDGKGYKCACHAGYEMDRMTNRCKATGEEPMLLFANRHDVRQIRLRSGGYKPIVDQLHSAIAIDYDYTDQLIYWSDVAEETISRLPLQSPNSSSKKLVRGDVNTPDGLALDWIHKNLYWTDTGSNMIEVMSVRDPDNAPWRMVLFNDKLDEPRAIVVDPRPGRWSLFWTDWGNNPKIERSHLDGSDRTVIVSDGIQWPNGLTIDYETNRIYWIDAKLHSIFSSDFDGEDRHLILTSPSVIRHPFAMTVFEDDIYWSDWEMESIYKVPKYIPPNRARNEVKSVAVKLYSPMGLLVYHRLKQPVVEDVCREAACNHLCLPRNSRKMGEKNFTCACSKKGNFKLASDGSSCHPTLSSDDHIRNPLDGKTDKIYPTNLSGENQKHAKTDSGHHHKKTIGFVICIIIAIIVILVSVAYLVYRSFKRKVPKILNFDNPVYRRTTDDTLVLQRNNKSFLPSPSSLLQPLTALNSDQV